VKFENRTYRALGIAVLVWMGSIATLAIAGLVTGVWRLSDLSGRAGAAFLSEFGVITIVGTFLFVGGSVFLWQRYGLIAPSIGLVCYVVYWGLLGVLTTAGVSALYVGAMYGLYAPIGIAILAALEWALRMVWPRQSESAG
jgi:hypothetical protein